MKRLITILFVLVTQQAAAGVECRPTGHSGVFCEKRDFPSFSPGWRAGYPSPSRDDVKRQVREALREHRQQFQQQQEAARRQALEQERRQDRALEQQQRVHEEIVERERRRQQRLLQQKRREHQQALLQQQKKIESQLRAQKLREESLQQQMEMQQLQIEMLRLEKGRRPARTPNEHIQPLIDYHDSLTNQ
jgi:flagellar biosynthesis GTPase FlhF